MSRVSSFRPEDMPVLKLDTSRTTRYEASRYLDSTETISAYLASSLESDDPQDFLRALAEVAKVRGINNLAREAGLNRESLYKALRPDAKPRYETIWKLIHALGVGLTIKPTGPKFEDTATPA